MSARSKSQTRPTGNVHGVLIVDKPGGITSHGVVGAVRRAFGTRRVGHAGTLDPMATGVLVMLLGEATKLSSVLTTDKKTYEALIKFGFSTDSLDADGTITKRADLPPDFMSAEKLALVLDGERKRNLQIPPQVSAIKVDGQRAYARARKGQVTDLPPRDVAVHQLEVIGQTEDSVSLRLCVSKGYYVRALAKDLGDALGVPSHLAGLRRIQSGPFTIEQAQPWPVDPKAPLMPLGEAARGALTTVQVNEEGAERLKQGKRIDKSHFLGDFDVLSQVPLLGVFHDTALIALIEPAEREEYRVKRGMNDPISEQIS